MVFCSTIIPTVGRSTLTRAVESVLKQDCPSIEFEVIVVNDSGKPLPEESWQQSDRVQIINTNRRERSVARNTGAAAAKGKYLHFLDDDDWLAPGAYGHFDALDQSSPARWLYGITQVIDRRGQATLQLRHRLQGNCFIQVMAGEWIPLQASLIERSAFMKAGGFNPLITGPEDIDLLRRLLLDGEAAETPNLVAYVQMGEEGSTTDMVHHPQASRWAREAIIDSSHVFARMRSSANNSFWKGRILRVYLTSAMWNLQHGRLLKFASRLCFAILSLLVAGKQLFSGDYWRAVSRPYESFTFQTGNSANTGQTGWG
jgi:glycosyltransferase involved in cell wall biosynthesis